MDSLTLGCICTSNADFKGSHSSQGELNKGDGCDGVCRVLVWMEAGEVGPVGKLEWLVEEVTVSEEWVEGIVLRMASIGGRCGERFSLISPAVFAAAGV